MKKFSLLVILTAMTMTINSAYAQRGERKILVAWYSWSGNTEAVGKHIRDLTGADVFIIEPANAYPSDYNECIDQAKKEINGGARPDIKGGVADIASYDVIILGTPNWWSTMAPPVLTFLSGHDLSGKTVLPFVTHGGGREARCFSDMEKAAPEAEFTKGLVVSGNRAGGSKSEVEKWLRDNGIVR